jgi:hypothetical protein
MPTTDLASYASFSAQWSATSVEDDLRRWAAFLAENGVTWSAGADTRELVDRLVRSGSPRAGEIIEARLSALANQALTSTGNTRLVLKLVSTEPKRAWYVLSPDRRSALEASGHRFESGTTGGLRQLATIPITLGVYVGAQYVCRQAGLDQNVAWVVALVAYVLTVRVVRGRWPLQRA